MARPAKSPARAMDPSAEAAAGPAAPAASPGEAGPVLTLNEVAVPKSTPKGVIDEMSELLELLATDTLRSVHALQANAEAISRQLAVEGHVLSHAVMADVANVVGEFRNGLHRILAPKH